MTPLSMRLLGVPEIHYGDRALSFRTRKVLALLIYLAVEGGMHSRESLAALLWPETESQNVAATLRATLSRLRRSLRPAGDVLLAEAGKVGLDSGCAIDLDLDWLATAILPETPPAALSAILEIDRGEFLAGFGLPDAPGFDTWAATRRQLYQQRVETVYDRLVGHCLALGDHSAAVEIAGRWRARAPLNESAYRRLMVAQALAGDRAAALTTYSQCREILQAELRIEPAQETEALARRIRASEWPPAHAAPATGESPRSHRRAALPFVGRQKERRQLATAFQRTLVAGARLAVVIGAGGMGKTRLVEQFVEWLVLETPTVDVWRGRAFELGGRLAYEPVIEALRPRLERENAPEDLLEDVWLAELSQLMPELRGRYPDLPPPMQGDANFVRSRLFAAVATLGKALAARQPALLVLDDMQWADPDTLDMVHYVARRWVEEGVPILLLLTVSQEQFASATQLREWLTRLERDVPATRLPLAALTAATVQQLIARLAAPAVDNAAVRAFAEWLWAETGGLPFFVDALLQMLVEQGVLAPATAHDGYDFAAALQHVRSVRRVPLPPGVRDVILARVERLSEPEAALLLAAAVLGRECSFTRLCDVAGMDELNALPALEALLNARLLVESRQGRRPYSVAHDHIREVVYGESGEARRRVLHRRALIALEAIGAPAAECAFHATASLLDEPAFRYSLAAGDEAFAKHALQESLAHYDRARDAARMIGSPGVATDRERLLRLYQNRGRVLELTNRYAEADANYRELAQMAEAQGEPALKQAALSARCVIHATHTPLFNPPLARELGLAALEPARALNDRAAEARALWCMMLVEFHVLGDSKQVLAYGEQALAMARELKLTELQGYVLSNLSWAYMAQERLEAARQANAEAEEVWQALGNMPMIADTLTIKLAIQRIAGEYDAILVSGRKLLQLSQATENSRHEVMALLNLGETHCLKGRLGQALAYFETGMALCEVHGDHLTLQGYYAGLILLYLAAGAPAQAEQWADKLLALGSDLMPVFRALFLAHVARAKIAVGNLGAAEESVAQALAEIDGESFSAAARAPLFVADGHLRLCRGEPAQALARVEALIARAQQSGSRHYLAEALWLKGRACLALARVGEARAALVEAKAMAEAQGERFVLWQILGELAALAAVTGDGPGAAAFRQEARATIATIADHIDDTRLKEAFLAGTAVSAIVEA